MSASHPTNEELEERERYQKALGRRIRTTRVRSGVKIEAAAAAAGHSLVEWKRIEAGMKLPGLYRLQRFADACGVDMGVVVANLSLTSRSSDVSRAKPRRAASDPPTSEPVP